MIFTSAMAAPAEHDLTLAEAEGSKERTQMFGILRLQEDKAAGEKASAVAASIGGSSGSSSSGVKSVDGRWQAPIFALARKASETFSGSIHVLPKVAEHKTPPFMDDWSTKGEWGRDLYILVGIVEAPLVAHPYEDSDIIETM